MSGSKEWNNQALLLCNTETNPKKTQNVPNQTHKRAKLLQIAKPKYVAFQDTRTLETQQSTFNQHCVFEVTSACTSSADSTTENAPGNKANENAIFQARELDFSSFVCTWFIFPEESNSELNTH